jgi:hypothetical protein
MCDPAGVCQPVSRKGACDDQNQCTEDDQCEGFFCIGTPRPAGAACDLDGQVCTSDTCDGAGTCTAGPCSPCCDAGAGCTPSPAPGYYTLCILEPAPIFSPQSRPAGRGRCAARGTCHGQPCWRAVPGIGFAYQDRDRTPNGIDKIGLKAGPAGTARVQVSAKGGNLIFGNAGGIAIPWSVQLRSSDGTCWESLNGRTKPNGQIDFNHGSPSGAFLD